MNKEELNQALYGKMSKEQDSFRSWLLEQPPEEILNHTSEDVCCKGEFQSLIQHDCGSLVVNGQAVVGKEENEYFQAFS